MQKKRQKTAQYSLTKKQRLNVTIKENKTPFQECVPSPPIILEMLLIEITIKKKTMHPRKPARASPIEEDLKNSEKK